MRRLHDHAQQLFAAEPRSVDSVGYWRCLGVRDYPLDPLLYGIFTNKRLFRQDRLQTINYVMEL
jgi:hypothetical protein